MLCHIQMNFLKSKHNFKKKQIESLVILNFGFHLPELENKGDDQAKINHVLIHQNCLTLNIWKFIGYYPKGQVLVIAFPIRLNSMRYIGGLKN